MINPIFHNTFAKTVNFGNSKVNMVYMNDMHGSLSNVDAFITGRDEFYRQNKEGTNWTVSGGDMFIKGSKNNPVVAKFIAQKVDVLTPGNHDLSNSTDFSNLLDAEKISHKFTSMNLSVEKNSPLDGKIAKSTIIQEGAEKIGFIGVSPFDFDAHVSRDANNDFISIKDFKTTIDSIKKEVANIESQGVNKIVLLAHTGQYSNVTSGIDYYKAFAKIGGIDVIVGGHDHIMTDEWETSTRRKENGELEPVRVVATGNSGQNYFAGNLNMFGTMNLEFDDNGVLVKEKCSNKIHSTHDYAPAEFINKYMSPNAQTVLGSLPTSVVNTSNPLRTENKVGNLVADSDFAYAKAHSTKGNAPDFAFVNAGTIRDVFPEKDVTKFRLHQVLPFKESIVKAELSKKQIYEALEISAKSATFKKATPGMMQVSHLTYTVNPDSSISDVKILDDEGNVRFNLEEMNDDDKFTCVYDSFLVSGPNLLGCLKSDVVEDFGVTRYQAMKEYLSNGNIADYSTDRIIVK